MPPLISPTGGHCSRSRKLRLADVFISDSRTQRTVGHGYEESALGLLLERCSGVLIRVERHNPRVPGCLNGVDVGSFPGFAEMACGVHCRYCSLITVLVLLKIKESCH